MEWFTVQYRDKDGSRAEAEFEAESRSALFKILAEKNISAISVAPGRLAKKSVRKPAFKKLSPSSPKYVRGIIAGLLVVICAVAAFFFLSHGDKKSTEVKEEKKPTLIPGAAQDIPKPTQSSRSDKIKEIKAELNDKVKEFVKKADTNNIIRLGAASLDPNDPDNALRTQTMTEVAMLVGIEPGDPMPPVPFSFMIDDDAAEEAAISGNVDVKIDGGNARFLEELKKWKITIKEADDAKRAAKKQELFEAQLELVGGMEEGVSVNDSIRAAYEFRKKAYETRNSLAMAIIELHESDPDEGVTKRMIDRANETLTAEGIKNISYAEIIPEYEESEENIPQEGSDE